MDPQHPIASEVQARVQTLRRDLEALGFFFRREDRLALRAERAVRVMLGARTRHNGTEV